MLLDCLAVVDTIGYEVLLDRLASRIGLDGTTLDWARSYLSNRTKFVAISESQSSPGQFLSSGVPRGLVLGSIFFMLYTLPPGDIVRRYNMRFHDYADEIQLNFSFDTTDHVSKAPVLHC